VHIAIYFAIRKQNYAKTLVDADRTALFLTDTRSRELYARVFDMGDETEASVAAATHIQKEIRSDSEKIPYVFFQTFNIT